MGVPGALQRRGQLHPLGDLRRGEPLVDHAQRLVVEVGVQVALLGKEGEGLLPAPDRPVVRGEHDVGGGAEELDGLGQVAGPVVRVAYLGAAQREQVVQGVGGVLGGAQGGVVGEVDVELGRGFGARGHLEHHADPVDGLALPGAGDVDGRRGEGDRARGGRGAQPRADLPARTLGQGGAVHVRGAAAHGGAGVDVLADGVLQEPLRREHRHAGRDLLDADHALDAAEVVDVAVRVQDAGDGALPAVAAVQRERGGRGLRRDERVDDQDAALTLDHGHVRQVEPAHLVDPRDHLEQPVPPGQPALAPQARMGGGRTVGVQEPVRVQIPHHTAVRVPDLVLFGRSHESAALVLRIAGVVEREAPQRGIVGLRDDGLGVPGRSVHGPVLPLGGPGGRGTPVSVGPHPPSAPAVRGTTEPAPFRFRRSFA